MSQTESKNNEPTLSEPSEVNAVDLLEQAAEEDKSGLNHWEKESFISKREDLCVQDESPCSPFAEVFWDNSAEFSVSENDAASSSCSNELATFAPNEPKTDLTVTPDDLDSKDVKVVEILDFETSEFSTIPRAKGRNAKLPGMADLVVTKEEPVEFSTLSKRKASGKKVVPKMQKKKGYQCEKCQQLFTNKEQQLKHMKRHENLDTQSPTCEASAARRCSSRSQKPAVQFDPSCSPTHNSVSDAEMFNYDKCSMKFMSKESLESHHSLNHTRKPGRKETSSGQDIESSNTCNLCGKSFSFSCNLKRHMDMHSGKTYACHICKKTFTQAGRRDMHVKVVHEGVKRFSCHVCGKNLAEAASLKKHMVVHTGARNQKTPGKTLPKLHQCQFCDKKFSSKSDFRSHERTHTGEKPFKCSFCDRKFTTTGHCKRHQRLHATEEVTRKPFKCRFCDQRFNQSGHCKLHERIHTNEKPYKCQYCDKHFRLRHSCQYHERTHTNDKPYRCRFCDKRCTTRTACLEHERTHTKDKPYKCRFCEKRCTQRTACLEHERLLHAKEFTHVCSTCGRRFIEQGALAIHEQSHGKDMEINPYKCPNCDKTFKCKWERRNHERLDHPGEKPYACQFCGQMFGSEAACRKHEKGFHAVRVPDPGSKDDLKDGVYVGDVRVVSRD